MLHRNPLIIVIAAPSGTGKTTVRKKIIKKEPSIKYSVSYTTRPPRKGEKDGVDYHFCTPEMFEIIRKKNKLLEWEEVYGYKYGTPKEPFEEYFRNAKDILMDLDVKGALNIKKMFPDAITIFLIPPSFEELKKRIEKREKSLQEETRKRLESASEEIKLAKKFDYIIINDKLQKTVNEIMCVINAERLKTKRVKSIGNIKI